MSPTSYRTAPPRVTVKTSQSITPKSVKKPTPVSILVPNRHTTDNPRTTSTVRVSAECRDSPRKTPRPPFLKLLGTRLANTSGVTVLGELLLVTSSVAVSLGLSRLALGELF